MSITLDAVSLPDDLIWADEFSWSSVRQKVTRSLTGSLIVQESAQLAGRPITLASGIDGAWVARSVVDELMGMVEQVDTTMLLTIGATPYNVRFNRSANESPVVSESIFEIAAPDADHLYRITIKLFAV